VYSNNYEKQPFILNLLKLFMDFDHIVGFFGIIYVINRVLTFWNFTGPSSELVVHRLVLVNVPAKW